MAAYVQNCLDQDVKSSALNQAKEVLNSYLKETLKYCKAEGTIDHNNPVRKLIVWTKKDS